MDVIQKELNEVKRQFDIYLINEKNWDFGKKEIKLH